MRKRRSLFAAILLAALLLTCGAPAEEEDFAAQAAASETPVTATIANIVAELTDAGFPLTLYSYKLADNGRQSWYYMINDRNYIDLVSNDQSVLSQIIIRTETLKPGDEWSSLCRAVPELTALSLPETILSELRTISLDNGGRVVTAEGDSYSIRVGGVMDVRSVWDLHFPGF